MRYGSVCSGIEAATVAWHPLGWRPAFFSQFDPEHNYKGGPDFPSAVLAHHYPHVPNLGDMTRFEDWPDAAIDVLVGGTPCQDFSVAGLRAGLDGQRGNLMLVYAAIARRYRPKWLVWENVPGVLSNNGGSDFGSLLGLLSGQRVEVPVDGWKSAGIVPGIGRAYGLAWRVLDAQYVRIHGFGVFVVGYLGDWRRAAAVLFERTSLSGHPAPRRQAGQKTAPTLSARTKGGGGLGTDFDCDGGLVAQPLNDLDGASHALAAKASASGYMDAHVETYVGEPLVFDETQITHPENRRQPRPGDPSHGLAAGARPPTIAFNIYPSRGQGAELEARETEVSNALSATAEAAKTERGTRVVSDWRVRRLTPTECARLQGFPDDYLDIVHRGKPAADGPKYKSLGNSMAVNCMRWIGTRIAMVDEIDRG